MAWRDCRAGLILIAWALYHWRYGSRHRVRVGLQTGLAGLGVWSFLDGHRAWPGLMLWPVLMPPAFPLACQRRRRSVRAVLLGVGLHTLAMLA